jgi:hypothetical protein
MVNMDFPIALFSSAGLEEDWGGGSIAKTIHQSETGRADLICPLARTSA